MTQASYFDPDDVPTPKKIRRGRPMEIHHWAGKIVQHIPSTPTLPGEEPEWVNATTLAYFTKLSTDQVYAAIGYLRDTYPDLPLISHLRKGYRFSATTGEVREYLDQRKRSIRTQLRRIWDGSIEPYLEQANVPQRAREGLKINFDRLLEDIEREVAI